MSRAVIDTGGPQDLAQCHLEELTAAEAKLEVDVISSQRQETDRQLKGLVVVLGIAVVRYSFGTTRAASGKVYKALELLASRLKLTSQPGLDEGLAHCSLEADIGSPAAGPGGPPEKCVLTALVSAFRAATGRSITVNVAIRSCSSILTMSTPWTPVSATRARKATACDMPGRRALERAAAEYMRVLEVIKHVLEA